MRWFRFFAEWIFVGLAGGLVAGAICYLLDLKWGWFSMLMACAIGIAGSILWHRTRPLDRLSRKR